MERNVKYEILQNIKRTLKIDISNNSTEVRVIYWPTDAECCEGKLTDYNLIVSIEALYE